MLSYVLPLRRVAAEAPDPLEAYLRWLAPQAEVIVVDGSPDGVFRTHAGTWGDLVTHVRPDPGLRCPNGKVAGVLTGVRLASREGVVLADDDVRFDEATLRAAEAALAGADLVRPQNHFDPLPWHARWDTARTLINRAFGADFPGTLIVRRDALLALGGYDCEVLFENLELIRTVRAAGGRVANRRDLHVRRLPPSAAHFWRQRVRQAYESSAQPPRLVVELSLLPGTLALLRRGRAGSLAAAAALPVLAAEAGRRRDGGRAVFAATASLWAPVWVAERALCAWVAVWMRFARGGIVFGGVRLRRSAGSRRVRRASYRGRLGRG